MSFLPHSQNGVELTSSFQLVDKIALSERMLH